MADQAIDTFMRMEAELFGDAPTRATATRHALPALSDEVHPAHVIVRPDEVVVTNTRGTNHVSHKDPTAPASKVPTASARGTSAAVDATTSARAATIRSLLNPRNMARILGLWVDSGALHLLTNTQLEVATQAFVKVALARRAILEAKKTSSAPAAGAGVSKPRAKRKTVSA